MTVLSGVYSPPLAPGVIREHLYQQLRIQLAHNDHWPYLGRAPDLFGHSATVHKDFNHFRLILNVGTSARTSHNHQGQGYVFVRNSIKDILLFEG